MSDFESFKKVDAETHRILLSNTVGHDLCGNRGRKAGSLSRKPRIKCIVEDYSQGLYCTDCTWAQQLAKEEKMYYPMFVLYVKHFGALSLISSQ